MQMTLVNGHFKTFWNCFENYLKLCIFTYYLHAMLYSYSMHNPKYISPVWEASISHVHTHGGIDHCNLYKQYLQWMYSTILLMKSFLKHSHLLQAGHYVFSPDDSIVFPFIAFITRLMVPCISVHICYLQQTRSSWEPRSFASPSSSTELGTWQMTNKDYWINKTYWTHTKFQGDTARSLYFSCMNLQGSLDTSASGCASIGSILLASI